MITCVPNDKCIILYGKQADKKPVEQISNGSQFVEQDTGEIYFFDEEHKEWLKFNKNRRPDNDNS